tara:strand:- start:1996 stop:3546 length:1551 start_codon:yes stop_codon:yes gene_type:complete
MSGIELIATAAKLAEDKYTINLDSPEVKKMIKIVEEFLIKKKLICYGGTAINNILPKKDQFYSGKEFPDYDFYSTDAMNDSKILANIYYKNGFTNVLAKSGVHYGTYKVIVNYIPVADITHLNSKLFKKLAETALTRKGIYYCPPDYLRMNMYLELSRPKGDVSRWEKVYSRLSLLNNHYPIKTNNCNIRSVDSMNHFDNLVDCFYKNKCVFFGGKALSIYSKYDKSLKNTRTVIDVFNEDPNKCISDIKKIIPNIKYTKDNGIHEVFPPHYILKINNTVVAIIYEPIACYSYMTVKYNNKNYRIASVFTLLSMYILFTYMDKCNLYNVNRIMCIANIIFDINEKNFGKGLFKEIPIECYGEMLTLEKIIERKTEQFKKLKDKRGTKEYDLWFLKYDPVEQASLNKKSKTKKKSKSKTKKKSKTGGAVVKHTVYYIHSPTCHHCIDFNPTWDKISEDYSDKHNMVKLSPEDNIPDHIYVTTVPHIVAEHPSTKKLTVFNYPTRTKKNLKEFLDNLY